MKRLIIVFITWMLVGVTVTAAWAAGPAKPVIVAEMPDCYMPIGSDGITLFTNASASDGGVLRYQWYATDIENMTMIRAIDGAQLSGAGGIGREMVLLCCVECGGRRSKRARIQPPDPSGIL